MKYLVSALACLFLPVAALAQYTATDTLVSARTLVSNTKVTRLLLAKSGGFLLGGEYDGGFNSSILAEGTGTRLLWYPQKAAFRAGYVDATQWDDANIGSYSIAAGYNTRALGDYSTAFGYNNVAAQVGSTALGQYCIASGAASVALGYYAHTNARQGSFVFSDRSVPDDGNIFTDESFRASVNHSANWRVSGGFRIFTSSNLSTGVTLQSGAVTSNWNQTNAVISTSTGAYLSTSGVWTNTSDVHKKHLFEAVSGEDVLARLRQVPIQRWSYKADNARVRHLGPMAQDFRRAFGLGPDSVSIGTVDADGVALAGVQALDARTRTQAAALAALQAENQALRARLDALERPGTPAGLPLGAGLGLTLAVLGGVVAWRRKAAPAAH
ncbi:tail fiber domain-containing protein [Hymenobacter negativus]|uniref:Peptidase S74 domain-containing protein n=1 Tax=Hymenobacter negativus TaxID=2795026 RepID=A0ABS3QIE9_9BACT|nr:tail fiber domain-containing protein [Hymenobacter negativus]MBO2011011.1 hypothetical protein [Hymenobacter negativus]